MLRSNRNLIKTAEKGRFVQNEQRKVQNEQRKEQKPSNKHFILSKMSQRM